MFNEAAVPFIQTARDNGLLFGGSDAPAMIDYTSEHGKSYHVRGSIFEVAPHFEVLNGIGYGAYGVVCAAVDLRLVASSVYYNEAMRTIEEEGRIVTRQRRGHDAPVYFRTRAVLDEAGRGGPVRVPHLYSEPFKRRTLARGEVSPFVAIKKVTKVFDDLVDGRRILREIKLLRYLQGHPNIVRLMEVGRPPAPTGASSSAAFDDIYLVTDLMDTDLGALLRSSQEIAMDQLRFIAYQLMKVLVYVHSSGVIHRDLKPGNILLNGNCDMKLCDFGLSRGGVPAWPHERTLTAVATAAESSAKELEDWGLFCWSSSAARGASSAPHAAKQPPLYSLTDYVVTRYYRAPELLIMGRYNHAIDMWSAGCILAEMVLRRPLFTGANYLSQLALILETPGLRGVPQTPEEAAALFEGGEEGKHFINDILFHKTARRRDPLTLSDQVHSQVLFHSTLFGFKVDVPISLGILIAKLLSFDPRKRPTALEALRDPFFWPLYDSRDEILRCPASDPSVAREQIDDIAAYQKAHPCVVVDESPVFTWEFDHRITSAQALRGLFEEECQISRDVQQQLERQQRLRSSPVVKCSERRTLERSLFSGASDGSSGGDGAH
ncbi:putative mitogen-activated protein kinase 7 [Leishmania major strain Friedlin]|uniref:non-specific serine/threonine protein kinase n=1 Tax=Leishmania major TaxID=5664 RepID=Q4QFZ0_LEIMA|nr:putative mitogen-activated protein kinase 7 [Leishmania major strain Friedlin]CAG9571175.1 mitogen-activated_protein_kinase_-_putative [Leishmania major strain Friedlin]CAJ03185.1 putative mitogen-activated protein kinase 7 [Leishmania major strain Friedlin]|eukprot:XP_001681908.1 putative mitogen-activated protein kinase 7 [Leishmania major strain Friedlin]